MQIELYLAESIPATRPIATEHPRIAETRPIRRRRGAHRLASAATPPRRIKPVIRAPLHRRTPQLQTLDPPTTLPHLLLLLLLLGPLLGPPTRINDGGRGIASPGPHRRREANVSDGAEDEDHE